MNASQRGSLRILKTSSDGKKEGFTFKVEGAGYSQTFVTDKNGEIFIENLRVGKYTVSEVATDATKEYKLPDAVEIEIIVDETLEVKVHNDKITVEYPPKTGDNSNMWLWVVLALLSGLGLAATLVVPKLRKKTRKVTSK